MDHGRSDYNQPERVTRCASQRGTAPSWFCSCDRVAFKKSRTRPHHTETAFSFWNEFTTLRVTQIWWQRGRSREVGEQEHEQRYYEHCFAASVVSDCVLFVRVQHLQGVLQLLSKSMFGRKQGWEKLHGRLVVVDDMSVPLKKRYYTPS